MRRGIKNNALKSQINTVDYKNNTADFVNNTADYKNNTVDLRFQHTVIEIPVHGNFISNALIHIV